MQRVSEKRASPILGPAARPGGPLNFGFFLAPWPWLCCSRRACFAFAPDSSVFYSSGTV